MSTDKELDFLTYTFAITTTGLFFTFYLGKGVHDEIGLLTYAIFPCLLYFIYQLVKLTSLKKEVKNNAPTLLKKISKQGSTAINTMTLFSNPDLFLQSKNEKIKTKFELAQKGIMFSFYSVAILIGFGVYSLFFR